MVEGVVPFVPFSLQLVKHPQFRKGGFAQNSRMLANVTHLKSGGPSRETRRRPRLPSPAFQPREPPAQRPSESRGAVLLAAAVPLANWAAEAVGPGAPSSRC